MGLKFRACCVLSYKKLYGSGHQRGARDGSGSYGLTPKPVCVIAAVRLSKALKDAHSKEPSTVHARAARF